MELLTGLIIGFLMRHYLPNLKRSRATDFKPPMAEYVHPSDEEIAEHSRRAIL